jgi:hypothetical protein
MCLLCIRLADAFEPDWPDMNPGAARGAAAPRPVLFCADAASASQPPDARTVTTRLEARNKS